MTTIREDLTDRTLWAEFARNSGRAFRLMLRQDWFGLSMLALLTLFILGMASSQRMQISRNSAPMKG